jgi:hypothetical protein
MLIGWILCIVVCIRGQRRFLPFSILLAVTLAMELTVSWLYPQKIEFLWMYHLYTIFEYTILCIYFMQIAMMKFKNVLLASIVLFALTSISVSTWYYHFDSFPGININAEGVLICVVCAYILMTLDIRMFDAIYKHPDFWICLGLLIFFGGTFFSNGLYTYLHDIDPAQAKRLFASINQPLNLILYTCFIIGFVCALPRRSSIPSY